LKRVGMALGGGGAKGIAHLAFLEVLDKKGIIPSVVSGTSIGSLIGALYCSGQTAAEIYEFLSRLDETTSSGRKRRLLIKLQASSPTKRAEWMKRFIETLLPVKTFEELKIPLKICAVNFYTLEEKMFTSGSLIDAMMASMALPGGIYPYKIGDEYYIDGGAGNVVPVDYIKDDCDVVVGIDVSSILPTPRTKKPTMKNARIAFVNGCRKGCLEYKLKEADVDLFYKIKFDNIGTLDFFKYKNAYMQGTKIAPKFEQDLMDIL